MFKKRTRPASVREKQAGEDDSPAPGTSGTNTPMTDTPGEDDEIGQNIEELILLRKLRKSKQGIDIEKLNRGEEKKKAKKAAEPEIDFSKYGLHPSKRADEPTDEFADENERLKRLVRNNNFTQQTNALDVDKHMMAYIEAEMEKRKGQVAAAKAEGKPEIHFDPQAELERLAERYKLDMASKKDEEGDVTNSMGMLTSIPEVDLGMENRLKNIEQTEKAKREMLEQRKAAAEGSRKGPQDEDYASARFFRGNRVVASDAYAMEDAKRAAAGLPPANRGPRGERPHQEATDDQAYERFKKRIKR